MSCCLPQLLYPKPLWNSTVFLPSHQIWRSHPHQEISSQHPNSQTSILNFLSFLQKAFQDHPGRGHRCHSVPLALTMKRVGGLVPEGTHEIFPGLPWWSSDKESTCQCGEQGFDPWSGKIPHALGQLTPCTTTTKPVLQGLQTTRSHHSEEPEQQEGSPCTRHWEKALTQQWRPRAAKNRLT